MTVTAPAPTPAPGTDDVAGYRAALRAALTELPDAARYREHRHDCDDERRVHADLQRWLWDGGWFGRGFPEDVGGLGGDTTLRGVLYDELAAAGLPVPENDFVIETVTMSVARFGTPEAKALVPAFLRGDELWCQGFSEPEAGSDLASLRTRAEEQEDGSFVVNGQKIWASNGSRSARCVLLARTGTQESRHRGLSMFLVDMDAPGVDARPIALLTGREDLAEIFFTDVRVPRSRLLGEVGQGWAVAMHLLQFERGMYAWTRQAAVTTRLQGLLHAVGPSEDPSAAEAVGRSYLALAALRARTGRTIRRLGAGETLGPETSIDKVLLAAAEQTATDVARELLETSFLLGDDPDAESWRDEWAYTRAASVYGGAAEVQRDIIADRVLGLPKEVTRGR